MGFVPVRTQGVGVHEGPHQHALRTEASASAHALYRQDEPVGGDLVYSKVRKRRFRVTFIL